MVFAALQKASLYANERKTELFRYEIDFLGHHISQRGIEPDRSKVERIASWPVPNSATKVRAFLGLVRFVAQFLPGLATYTETLTPLTTKNADKLWPGWTAKHQSAFERIKGLVTGADCLTVIDHDNLEKNKIFVTTDASDSRTGAILSFGESWQTARPVAFDSMTLKGAELNYAVHEKELLAIIRALKKWRSDLLGSHFTIYTDHRTLENFMTQKELSRRQARWSEFLSQFDFEIVYLPGQDNTGADALSRTDFDREVKPVTLVLPQACPSPMDAARSLSQTSEPRLERETVGAILEITTDDELLDRIRSGYEEDSWTKKLPSISNSLPGLKCENGLWFIGERLIIPRANGLRETFFQIAHDALGHFGFDKSYASLRNSYYWPNMRKEFEGSYIPSCADCQRNKSRTHRKGGGPLHPLPVPDGRCESVALDFIGPLPEEEGFNCLLTLTCRLGSDVQFVPCRTDLTAKELATLFFKHWYCENGLPMDLVSDRDKLFLSDFWKALHKLTGVKLRMSTSYHPQSDGASERTNKTLIQAIRFHVAANQSGWLRALPIIRFNIMNSVNASTGFSGFQLRYGRVPRVLPALVAPEGRVKNFERDAADVIAQLELDVAEAQENLIAAKAEQAYYANKDRGPLPDFKVGDRVLLDTKNRRRHFIASGSGRVAKFMVRGDGPYEIIAVHPECSTVTLDLRGQKAFPVFHASEVEPFVENDGDLFPERELPQPGPVVTPEGQDDEYLVERIVDERLWRKKVQYKVRWYGWGPEYDEWKDAAEVEDLAVLDAWKQGASQSGIADTNLLETVAAVQDSKTTNDTHPQDHHSTTSTKCATRLSKAVCEAHWRFFGGDRFL
uniref:Reverse transcriptase-RNase H-integrase n=1 Tax=Mycena chlorophos TaxID=658473 RepID=A0ABQ0L1E8_MYCCL|nr:reverse transcriptase-RNase H-integrase [Mycena chlorophos]